MSDPYESIDEIVKTKCVRCGKDIDCRRFVCYDCYLKIIKKVKKSEK